MSPGTVPDTPGDAPHPSTSDATAPDAPAPDEVPADGARRAGHARRGRPLPAAERPALIRRRQRLQALAGAAVRGSDGKTVGRVRDVYLQDATGELAAITVMPRQLSAGTVLIPAAAFAALPDGSAPLDEPAAPDEDEPGAGGDQTLHLLIDTATAKAGSPPPLTGHLTPAGLRDAAAALHLEEGDGPT